MEELTVVKGSKKAGKVKSAHGKSSVRCGRTSNATIPSGGPSFKIYFDMEDTEGSVCDGSALSVFTLPDNEQGKFKAKSIWGGGGGGGVWVEEEEGRGGGVLQLK